VLLELDDGFGFTFDLYAVASKVGSGMVVIENFVVVGFDVECRYWGVVTYLF